MNLKVKIALIEDQPSVCETLETILSKNPNIEKVISFHSAEECEASDISEIDIFVIDVRLPGMDGITFLSRINDRRPESKKLIMTMIESDDIIFQALKLGCIGYVLKTDIDKISEIIDITAAGGAYMSPSAAIRVMNFFYRIKNNDEYEKLTEKETQILKELSAGYTPAEIAEALKVTVSTVRFHIRGIYQKLQVNNRIQMLKRAEGLGII
ncbi:MAG TPA: response regulator transcription factor [Leptospiraceae bacterium]|nr:response regulator transcription factor [Leptospiraceae bacterium]HNM02835.1 response regulator transcription factor [Leptospiraceae bacterium]